MHIIIGFLGKKKGGAEEAFLRHVKILLFLKHQVTAVVPPEWPYIKRLAAFPVTIVTIGYHSRYDPITIWRLRYLIKKVKPDMVIAHATRAIYHFSRAARGLVPSVAVNHGYRMEDTVTMDWAVALTDHMREKMAEAGMPAARCLVIPNGIFKTLPKPDTTWHTPPVIGTMARFEPEKGIGTLLAACAALKQNTVLPFKMVIGGEGRLQPVYEAYIRDAGLQDRVRFLGWVNDKEEFFSQVDIFCLSSFSESFGLTILDAWGHATPVVATDCTGPLALIEEGKDGMIVPKNNPEAMGQAFYTLLTQPALAHRMAVAGHKKVIGHYSFPAISQRWQDFLEGVQQNSPNSRKEGGQVDRAKGEFRI